MTRVRSDNSSPSSGLRVNDLNQLAAERIEARNCPISPVSVDEVRAAGWGIEDLWLPAVVLRQDAVAHNLDRFPQWCATRSVDHAPHGKTTMAPQLWDAQLRRGAWGLSAATVDQVRVMRRFGVPRVLLANEVADPAQLRWLATTLADSDFGVWCLADSLSMVTRMEDAVRQVGATRSLPVLVELGVPGRRTGARTVSAALAVAERVAGSEWLCLAGVEGYEGVLTRGREAGAVAAAREFLDGLIELAGECDRRALFRDTSEIVVTAGGSAYFDLVADAVAAGLTGGSPSSAPGQAPTTLTTLSKPVRPLLRSGCYLTHDHFSYEYSSPLRSGADPDPLRPALYAYARVLSCPERGRALLAAGRRDVPFDITLPVPLSVRRGGAGGDSVARDIQSEGGRARIVELNDHHAFCDHDDLLQPGDVVELGLAHPCTTFDKWPLIPIVDGADRVVDAVRTLF